MNSRIVDFPSDARPVGRGLVRLARRFRRRDDGSTVVEFAFVIVPFLALLFAIIETALVFFAGQVLETAVADTSRMIMTGQAQKQAFSEADFKNEVCAKLAAMFDCDGGIKIDVRKQTSFGDADLSQPLDSDGNVDTTDFGYQPGVQGDVIVVRVVYEWPTFVRQFGLDLATLPNGKRLLMSTAAFRNEPYNN